MSASSFRKGGYDNPDQGGFARDGAGHDDAGRVGGDAGTRATGYRRTSVKTLRERAWREACASDKDWILDLALTLESCQTLDATSAFSYFWDETPNEDTFYMGDLPAVGLPHWLTGDGRGRNAVFVESRAPASGLSWSLVLDHQGRSGPTSRSEVTDAAVSCGVPAVSTNGDPGAMAVDPGLIGSAGALIYVDRVPKAGPARDFYLNFVEHAELDSEWARVLHFIPFAAFEDGVCGGAVLLPQVVYYMPIGHDGRVRPLDRAESVPMVIPDQDPAAARSADHDTMASILAKGHRSVHLAVLFSLVCAGVSGSTGEEPAVLEDSIGVRRVLQMDAIRAELDAVGRAGSLGLSHALTVCRESFGSFAGPAEQR